MISEVPVADLLQRLKEELKKMEELTPPPWSYFVKTGVSRERPPEQLDWWHMRAASILRRIYVDGPVGVSRLRTYYGGRQNRGQPPEHFRKGSGKIIRTILQQLEKAGLVKKEKSGRKITKKGISLLEKVAGEIAKR
ncbi:MAG: 30S ribosomal protein S19e [Candidatus Hadarchaeales archaeon]